MSETILMEAPRVFLLFLSFGFLLGIIFILFVQWLTKTFFR
jgi:hypothetical protein